MIRLLLSAPLLVWLLSASTFAQGLRVSTVVYDAGRLGENGREVAVSNSFALFHNGLVYDYVEAAGEVVIFDPIAKRFTVMNPGRGVFTSIAFPELSAMLAERAPKTEEYINELATRKSPQAQLASRLLKFQLNPKFETKTYSGSGAVLMTAASWKYQVSTREWDDPDQVKRYLDYADWAARLNCVLHPSNNFPEPRVALNTELRNLKNRIPVIVKLDRRPDESLVLRAEHQFIRNLTDRDRSLITGWNESLKSTELKQLPLHRYQETVLVSKR